MDNELHALDNYLWLPFIGRLKGCEIHSATEEAVNIGRGTVIVGVDRARDDSDMTVVAEHVPSRKIGIIGCPRGSGKSLARQMMVLLDEYSIAEEENIKLLQNLIYVDEPCIRALPFDDASKEHYDIFIQPKLRRASQRKGTRYYETHKQIRRSGRRRS
jgi:hypothetical protein